MLHRKQGTDFLTAAPAPRRPGSQNGNRCSVLDQELFTRMLRLERGRAERSRKPFLLMVVDGGPHLEKTSAVMHGVAAALDSSTRETDLRGWYARPSALGVIFTEIGDISKEAVVQCMRCKVVAALKERLSPAELAAIGLSFHVYPEYWKQNGNGNGNGNGSGHANGNGNGHANGNGKEIGSKLSADVALYPDLSLRDDSRKFARAIKRSMDLAGSLALLALLSPLMLLAALLIKLTSKGPVLFRQERVGKYGKTFTLFKFRTMKVQNNESIHHDYVKQFIEGTAKPAEGGDSGTYKITRDPRVHRVGSFLRKTSLDELPQLLNVVTGEMSLVGPRPPIPYELEYYDIWHRRRILEARPGITGLWQVTGRSKTKFDEMVRLDLQYAESWSLWLDVKILLQTPKAVFSTEGAY